MPQAPIWMRKSTGGDAYRDRDKEHWTWLIAEIRERNVHFVVQHLSQIADSLP